MRPRLIAAGGALFLGHACDHCGPIDEKGDEEANEAVDGEVCGPCDPVALLQRDGDSLSSSELVALPSDADAYCADHSVHPEVREAWLQQECWEYTAHYTARTLDYSMSPDAEYRAKNAETFACPPVESDTSGGPPPPPPQSFDIVGPADLGLEVRSPIAMLIKTTLLDATDESVLASDLPSVIADAMDGAANGPAEWVSGYACTAFLVGPRHVLTARHCVGETPIACGGTASNELSDKSLVFDYDEQPQRDTTIVSGMTVVACGTQDPNETDDRYDWALLELDGPPPGDRSPLELPAPGTSPPVCESIYVIGHPLGHPQYRSGSVDPNAPSAWVRSTTAPGVIPTTLDVIWGFSGAPVFALDGDRLVGILVRGRYVVNDNDMGWLFECSSVGCLSDDDYGHAVDLAAIAEQLQAHLQR